MPSLAWPMQARLNSIPLTEGMSAAVARRLIIARVGGLMILNGSEVRRVISAIISVINSAGS